IGVGARDLKECLLLQAQAYYPDESLVEYVITDHLELLANKKWQEISRLLHVPLTGVKRISDIIQTLDPKPGAREANASTAQYLYPDITIDKENDEYII